MRILLLLLIYVLGIAGLINLDAIPGVAALGFGQVAATIETSPVPSSGDAADVEGLTLYYVNGGTGYLIASNQAR